MEEKDAQAAVRLLTHEKQGLIQQVEDKEQIIQKERAKMYDLNAEVNQLKNKVKLLEELNKVAEQAANSHSRSSSFTGLPLRGQRKPGKVANKKTEKSSSKAQLTGLRHPVIPLVTKDILNDSKLYYKEISRRLPDIKVAEMLDAETKFLQADTSGDGLIDCDEFEKLLTVKGALLTRKQVEALFAEIDCDGTGTIDFIEVLEVIGRLEAKELTGVPQDLEKRKSAVCAIQ